MKIINLNVSKIAGYVSNVGYVVVPKNYKTDEVSIVTKALVQDVDGRRFIIQDYDRHLLQYWSCVNEMISDVLNPRKENVG